jgi:16S rRNA (guanine966-N2)-methyltransferase
VGLEARSRGAGVVTLVEQDRRTAAVIRENARGLGLDGVEVLVSDAGKALGREPLAPYDVAFLDPPYAVPVQDVQRDLQALREHGWLARSALVVVERSSRGPALVWPKGFDRARTKRYGETSLWYGHASD